MHSDLSECCSFWEPLGVAEDPAVLTILYRLLQMTPDQWTCFTRGVVQVPASASVPGPPQWYRGVGSKQSRGRGRGRGRGSVVPTEVLERASCLSLTPGARRGKDYEITARRMQ